jgi:hypothetical protein
MRPKDKEVYNFYKEYMGKERECPSLAKVGINADISRQRAGFYVDRLEKEGFLIKIKFKANQPVLLPHEWIKRYTKKDLKK